jgi:putative lipoic acid-binding regulatory protein
MADEDRPSFIELLRTNHEFPGPFTFKVIGLPDRAFVARVMLAIREELRLEADPPFTLRQSTGGKYVALTLEPYLMAAEEVIAVYEVFQKVEGIITVV